MTHRWRWMVLGLSALVLGACSEMQLVMHTAKRVSGSADHVGESGAYKVGEPYQIAGVWYYPKVDYEYVESGIASWYGPKFHGKPTANGEIFDQNDLTAAHRTLPLPSFVRVTNLENGRALKLRVNDRGPFAHGRILDVSRRAAQLLGFANQGTARVRVEVLADESRALAARLQNRDMLAEVGSPITAEAMPKPAVSAQALPPPGGGLAAPAAEPVPIPVRAEVATADDRQAWAARVVDPVAPRVQQLPVAQTDIFVQAGAFAYYDSANKVRARLASVGQVAISSVLVDGKDLFRVRVGPLTDVAAADRALEAVIQAGYPDARIIVD